MHDILKTRDFMLKFDMEATIAFSFPRKYAEYEWVLTCL